MTGSEYSQVGSQAGESGLCFSSHVSIASGDAHPPQCQTLRVIILCFLVTASTAVASSDMLAAVRMVGVKGEVTMLSKAACFPLSQLSKSTSAAWLGVA